MGDFNTALSLLDRATRLKLNKNILALKRAMEDFGLPDYIGVSIPRKLYTYSFLMHMGHSPK